MEVLSSPPLFFILTSSVFSLEVFIKVAVISPVSLGALIFSVCIFLTSAFTDPVSLDAESAVAFDSPPTHEHDENSIVIKTALTINANDLFTDTANTLYERDADICVQKVSHGALSPNGTRITRKEYDAYSFGIFTMTVSSTGSAYVPQNLAGL